MTKRIATHWWLPLGLGLMLVLLLVVGALAYDRLTADPESASVPGLTDAGPTAQQAFASVSDVATAWQKDARLTAALARQANIGTKGEDQIEWAFQFFSPSTRRLALFTVSRGEVEQVRERLSPYQVPTLSTDRWQIDSDQALHIWWHQGGDYVASRRPDVEVTMRLYTPQEGSTNPTWMIAGSLPNQENTFVVRIDAVDGTVLKP